MENKLTDGRCETCGNAHLAPGETFYSEVRGDMSISVITGRKGRFHVIVRDLEEGCIIPGGVIIYDSLAKAIEKAKEI